MGLGDCKTCQALREQVKHLQGLLDQTLNMIAPKTDSPEVEVIEKEDKIVDKFGE